MSETTLDPEDVAGHVTLAHELTEAGYSPEALAAVRAALRLSPDNSELYGLLGFHLLVKACGDGKRARLRSHRYEFEAAAAAFQRAIELDPTNTYALSYLGKLYWWLGNSMKAIELLQAALAAGADDFRTLNTLGYCQGRMRDFRGMVQTAKAINALPASKEKDENDREIYRIVQYAKVGLAVAASVTVFLIWRKWRRSSRG